VATQRVQRECYLVVAGGIVILPLISRKLKTFLRVRGVGGALQVAVFSIFVVVVVTYVIFIEFWLLIIWPFENCK
jgi:hypothetical protein